MFERGRGRAERIDAVWAGRPAISVGGNDICIDLGSRSLVASGRAVVG